MRLQSAINKLEAERAELESVLSSGMLGRSNNLVRLLNFVCEKYFEGRTPKTEYRLTQAGRRALERYLSHMETLIRVTREG